MLNGVGLTYRDAYCKMVTDQSNTIVVAYSNNRYIADEVVISLLRYYYEIVIILDEALEKL